MSDEKQERISQATKDAAARDAEAAHGAPQEPTPLEEEAADAHGPASKEVAESYEEYLDVAADAKGEGRIP